MAQVCWPQLQVCCFAIRGETEEHSEFQRRELVWERLGEKALSGVKTRELDSL